MKLVIGLFFFATAALAAEVTDPIQTVSRQAGHFSLPTYEAAAKNCTGEVYPECIDRAIQSALRVGQWAASTSGVVCGEDYPQCLETIHGVVRFDSAAYETTFQQCGETYPDCQDRAVGSGIGSSKGAHSIWKSIRDFFRGSRGDSHHDECPGCYVGAN